MLNESENEYTLTVEQLIKRLKLCDPKAIVQAYYGSGGIVGIKNEKTNVFLYNPDDAIFLNAKV